MPPTATELLSDSGPVAARLRELNTAFESRPEQIEMADAVARAMDRSERLIVEAGTGVGKSFAYLVPAILRATQHGEKVVVATATIALQEQLIQKDIPLLAKALEGVKASRFQGVKGNTEGTPSLPPSTPLIPVLAKGRGNYVSIRRLELASARQLSLLGDQAQRRTLHAIEDWAYATADGSLSTLPAAGTERPDVWDHVRSDTDNCMGRKCPQFKKCFYQRARQELARANLIVCNHALFFADLALRTRNGAGAAILPSYDHIILDEAHNIEDAASEHFGLSLTQPRVLRLLRTLYAPRRRKGYLMEKGLALADTNAVDRAITLVQHAETACRSLFDDLHEAWRRNRSSSGRLRKPAMDMGLDNPLSPAMSELAVCLRRLRDGLEAEEDRFELNSYAKRAADIADAAEAMLEQTLGGGGQSGEYVYWVDVEGGGSGGDLEESNRAGRFTRVTLACAPVDVSRLLRKSLFEQSEQRTPSVSEGAEDEGGHGDLGSSDVPLPLRSPAPTTSPDGGGPSSTPRSVILTSATLATRRVGDGEHPERAETAFAHLIARVGVEGARTIQLGSPFDYARQARLIVDLSVPDPKTSGRVAEWQSGKVQEGSRSDHSATSPPGHSATPNPYNSALASRVVYHVLSTHGGAFVLFTSFATMYAVADLTKEAFEAEGLTLLVQGRDGPRTAMLERFLEIEDKSGSGKVTEWQSGTDEDTERRHFATSPLRHSATSSSAAVLFGAASFWQGVDVRGERLRNVIITRLPFEPPDRPLTQARLERIEAQGGNPFMQDSLPRAIIRFKQGFGRLIRSTTDTGRVVVLDPRIRTARYGRLFLNALPEGVRMETEGRGEPA